MNKALVAVDLHGTLQDKDGEPEPNALESMQELKSDGHEIGVFTCGPTDEAKAWLDEHGFPYDYVNEDIPTRDSNKPDADLLIDNSAIHYDGDWNRTLAQAYATGKLDKGLCMIKASYREQMEAHPQLEWYETMLYNTIKQKPRSIGELRHQLSDTKLVDYVVSEMLRMGLIKDIDDPKRPGGTLYAEKSVAKARDPKDIKEFAAEVNRIARSAPASAKYGSKVYIGYVDYEYSIPNFKQLLLEAQRAGLVSLARADMPETMDPRDHRASTVYHDSGFGEFQLIIPKGIKAGGTIMPEGMTRTGLEGAKRLRFIGKSSTGGKVYRRA